jgi:hypothetical protein
VHVTQIVGQGLLITWEHCLSRFESWWICGNNLNFPNGLVFRLSSICLAVITFGNSKSSSILRDGVCMSTG